MLMSMSRIFSPARYRELWKNRDGISAVEFALVAPLMVLIYFGCIELSFMMLLDRKVTSSTSTLGDLVARAQVIDNDQLDDIFQATRMIMQPNDITVARMRVSSLENDGGTVKVLWSDGRNFAARPVGSTVTVPTGLVPDGGTIIYSEIEYDYSSVVGYVIKNDKTLSDQFYLRPRNTNSVTRKNS